MATPPGVRTRLGFDVEPRAADEADPAVELLLALRRQQLGQCYEQARTDAGVRTELFVAFTIDADGKPARSRAAAEPTDPLLEACGIDLVASWEFPVPKEGVSGPFLVRYAFEPAPPGPRPRSPGEASSVPPRAPPAASSRSSRCRSTTAAPSAH